MILDNHKTSLQIPQQLPEFVRDDINYETFVSFLEAYYQWMETAQASNSAITTAATSDEGLTYASKNLQTYSDIDTTLDGFVDYFINDFLPYIPADALTDRTKLLKISKELYKTKGIESSFKFLFRALYNSSAELFLTSDTILKPSDGKWIITKSLRINSSDVNWLLLNNLRLFGETTKSYATVDYATIVGSKTEIFISNIQRLFHSGEIVRVVDNNNLDVYFYGGQVYLQNSGVTIPEGATTLTSKIVGVISSIKINPNDRGQFYHTGDPVIIKGGLNTEIDNPIGASAVVGVTTSGSVKSVVVVDGSNGFRLKPNSEITFSGGGGIGTEAEIEFLDEENLTQVGFIGTDSLGIAANVVIGDASHIETYNMFAHPGVSNTNSRLIDAFHFTSFTVGPIASVHLISQGGGYSSAPEVIAHSYYDTDIGQSELSLIGMLQPIRIVNGGTNYSNTDTIEIVGGVGEGAYANLTVNATGTIVGVDYIFADANTNITYPLGGFGYTAIDLPTVIITTEYGEGAKLIVPGIMGDGAKLYPTTDKVGQISTIDVTNAGEDYISTPTVYLDIQDIAVNNVSISYTPVENDIIYQGGSYSTSTYSATLSSIVKTSSDPEGNTQLDAYQMRVYNYVGNYTEGEPLHVDHGEEQLTFNPVLTFVTGQISNPTTFSLLTATTKTPDSSILRYGDGNAKATAYFLDGLIVGQGKYLNEDGQPSSLGLVLQSLDYNSYTYVLSVEQALKTYKDLVLNLLHPSGMKLIGRNLLRSSNSFNFSATQTSQIGYHLDRMSGENSYAVMEVDTNTDIISTNVVKFTGDVSTNIGETILVGNVISFISSNNVKVYSTITMVDYLNNEITLSDNVVLTFANVAYGYSNGSSNVINITSVTGQFDGNFGDIQNSTPANSIIYVGDQVSLNGDSYYTVTKVFANGNISLGNSYVGPIENARITVNKNANTQDVMIYGIL